MTLKYRKELHSEIVEVLDGIECDQCHTVIPHVNHVTPGILHITLSGGYADYLDGTAIAHLCRSCADKFCQSNAVVARAIEEAGGWI